MPQHSVGLAALGFKKFVGVSQRRENFVAIPIFVFKEKNELFS